jgi:hypothetical protein
MLFIEILFKNRGRAPRNQSIHYVIRSFSIALLAGFRTVLKFVGNIFFLNCQPAKPFSNIGIQDHRCRHRQRLRRCRRHVVTAKCCLFFYFLLRSSFSVAVFVYDQIGTIHIFYSLALASLYHFQNKMNNTNKRNATKSPSIYTTSRSRSAMRFLHPSVHLPPAHKRRAPNIHT